MRKYFTKTPYQSNITESSRQNSKDKIGRIKRKPETSFFQKKASEVMVVNPRERINSEINMLTTHKSQEQLRMPSSPQIKFLSPKNIKEECRIYSMEDYVKSQKSPRFSRTNQWDNKKYLNCSIQSNAEEDDDLQKQNRSISNISLESTRKQTQETMPNTHDWSTIQRQNQALREDNNRLKLQNSKLVKKINQSTQSQYARSNISAAQKTGKCKNCSNLDEQLKVQSKYLKLFEATIAQKQKQVEKLKNDLLEAQNENIKEREKYSQLKQQVRTIMIRYEKQFERNDQLQKITNQLKASLQKSQQQKRYLSIQQSMLLKKKQDSQKWKQEASKLRKQKQILKELVSTYKQRLEKAPNKKKLVKSKSNYLESSDLFELSSEQSDGNF